MKSFKNKFYRNLFNIFTTLFSGMVFGQNSKCPDLSGRYLFEGKLTDSCEWDAKGYAIVPKEKQIDRGHPADEKFLLPGFFVQIFPEKGAPSLPSLPVFELTEIELVQTGCDKLKIVTHHQKEIEDFFRSNPPGRIPFKSEVVVDLSKSVPNVETAEWNMDKNSLVYTFAKTTKLAAGRVGGKTKLKENYALTLALAKQTGDLEISSTSYNKWDLGFFTSEKIRAHATCTLKRQTY